MMAFSRCHDPSPGALRGMARDIARREGSIVVHTTIAQEAEKFHPLNTRDLFIWAATLLAFPVAGVAADAVVGPVDSVWTAVLAGAIAGGVIGTGQWLALRRIGADVRWIAATAVGLGIGLGLAFAVFGYGTTTADLAVLGAVTGLGIGIAQWWLLRDLVLGASMWVPTSAVAWALGWTVTMSIGIDPADRWAVPGLSGALTITLLMGGLLWFLARRGVRAHSST